MDRFPTLMSDACQRVAVHVDNALDDRIARL